MNILPRALRWLPWPAVAMSLVVAGVVMIDGHWTPVGDDAMITSFSLDSITSHPPRLGMPTSLSIRAGEPVRHPGPLPFWVIGLPARLFGAPGYGVLIAVVATNVAMVGLGAVVAAQLRPRLLAPLIAVSFAVLIAVGVGPSVIIRPFNPYMGVLASLAMMIAMWSTLAGNAWALPVFVATGSLAAQSHVTLLPLVGVLVLVVLASLIFDLVRDRRAGVLRQPKSKWPIIVSVALGIVLWSGPLVDQVIGSGNLTALLRGSGQATASGWRYGVERLVDAIAPQAIWTTRPRGGPLSSPSSLRWVVAAAVLGVLVAIIVHAIRTRRRTLAALCVTALSASLASASISARVPADERALMAPANRLFWWPVGCMVWLALVASIIMLVVARVPRTTGTRRRASALVTRTISAVALVSCTWLGFELVRSTSATEFEGSATYGAARVHAEAIDEVTPSGGTVRLLAPDTVMDNYTFTQSLIAQLRLRDMEVQAAVTDPWGHFTAYRQAHPTSGPADVSIYIQGNPGSPPPPAGARVLSTYDPADPPEAFRGYDRPIAFGAGVRVSRIYLVPGSG